MYPLADVPVIQLSINAQLPYEYHHDLGASLAPLRQEGVLIVASGNVVHNLGLIDWSKPGQGEPWAHVFDDAVRATMTSDPDSLAGVLDLPEARAAVPTADHFLPLAYIAGLAAASSQTASTLLDGYDMGSLSMTAYELAAID
jgi:4,5-DOPA dioxygenase extradiol